MATFVNNLTEISTPSDNILLYEIVKGHINEKLLWRLPQKRSELLPYDAGWGYELCWCYERIVYVGTNGTDLILHYPGDEEGEYVSHSIDFYHPNAFGTLDKTIRQIRDGRFKAREFWGKIFFLFWALVYILTEIELMKLNLLAWIYVPLMFASFAICITSGDSGNIIIGIACAAAGISVGSSAYDKMRKKHG
jgi:hypothetical protein